MCQVRPSCRRLQAGFRPLTEDRRALGLAQAGEEAREQGVRFLVLTSPSLSSGAFLPAGWAVGVGSQNPDRWRPLLQCRPLGGL